ncbi:AfsR/SARP family transcriptional regulator, partial [Streptosporangium canum]
AERAAELARRTGASEVLARADQMLGRVARLRGEPDEARRLSEAALAECPAGSFGAEESRTHIMIELGLTAEAGGDAPTALVWYRRALVAASGQRDMTTAALVTEVLSGVALLEGDGERAAMLLGAGTAVRGTAVAGDADVARLRAAAREALGDEGYEKAYERGVSLTREEALALAGAPVD